MLDAANPEIPRKDWMSVLSKAPVDLLAAQYEKLGPEPGFDWLRVPEIGTVMVRGRAGGTGAPFNLGEMTVTRCSLQLADGTVGHAYVPGRDRDHARRAAICDALMQGMRSSELRTEVILPLANAHRESRAATAGQAEETRVDFFTMVRGEG